MSRTGRSRRVQHNVIRSDTSIALHQKRQLHERAPQSPHWQIADWEATGRRRFDKHGLCPHKTQTLGGGGRGAETRISWSIYLVTQLSISGKLLLRMAVVTLMSKKLHVRTKSDRSPNVSENHVRIYVQFSRCGGVATSNNSNNSRAFAGQESRRPQTRTTQACKRALPQSSEAAASKAKKTR